MHLTVLLKAREFSDSSFVKHEFIKTLHGHFKIENIVILFPIRSLEFTRDTTEALQRFFLSSSKRF